MFNLLTTIPTDTIANVVDTVVNHSPMIDTVGKTQVQKGIIDAVTTLQSTPADELLMQLMNKALAFGLKVVMALVIYAVGAWLIRWCKKFLARMFEKKKTDPAITSFTMSFVSMTLTIILIIVTVGALGVNTTSLAALLAAGGMAIGMALSGTVQNFAGGLMLLFFKPFRVGDFIEASGKSGVVTEVNITSTKIKTGDNKVIVMPNGALSNNTIVNYSQQPYRRVDWDIDVEYGSDAAEVKAVLRKILESDSRVVNKANGSPDDVFVEVSSLKDSSVLFTCRAWVKSADYWAVYFAMNEKIYTELPKHGIGFPFPHMDVTMLNDKQN